MVGASPKQNGPGSFLIRASQAANPSLLAHAAHNVPFFHKRWGGTAPKVTSWKDIKPVSKTELIENFDEAVMRLGGVLVVKLLTVPNWGANCSPFSALTRK